MKKLLILSALLFCVSFFGYTQFEQDSAWIKDNYTKRELYIPMRDGIKLFTALYIPKDKTEKHPFLISRTPYSCTPYGEQNFAARLWLNYYRYYLRENYIMVYQDVRGRYMSEGEFMDVRPFNPDKKNMETDEASDTYDTIDWLLKNISGNNGNTGVFGISYPGFYSSMAALSGHPALKAVSPQAPVTDWFTGDDFHHNGVFFPLDGFSFFAGRLGFGFPRRGQTMTRPSTTLAIAENDNYETFLRIGPVKNLLKLAGDSVAFLRQLFAHPNYDAFWKTRNVRNALQYVPAGTATLVVGGLFDAEDIFGTWKTYEGIEQKSKNNNKLVMGPWFHGQWSIPDGATLGNIRFNANTSIWYQNHIELPFFNYYLKGKGDISALPEATIFFTGRNEWQQLDRWPPLSMKTKPLYLRTNGQLGWRQDNNEGFNEYTSDPANPVPYTEDVHYSRTRNYMNDDQRFADRRPDVLTFKTDTLTEEITLAGPVIADLLTSISTTDADFVVKLIDVFPDHFKYADPAASQAAYPMGGYQMLVRAEPFRGRYRKSFSVPEAFTPGKKEQVKFELPDVAHTFQKGHRIMIQIQSSWFPLTDRNPQKFVNIYEADEKDFQKANIRIFCGGENSSKIILPVLQK